MFADGADMVAAIVAAMVAAWALAEAAFEAWALNANNATKTVVNVKTLTKRDLNIGLVKPFIKKTPFTGAQITNSESGCCRHCGRRSCCRSQSRCQGHAGGGAHCSDRSA